MNPTALKDFITTSSLVKRVEELTAANDHTEALITIAQHYNLTKFVTILSGIKTIRDAEGYLPVPVHQYQQEIYRRLLAWINDNYPMHYYDIYSAL